MLTQKSEILAQIHAQIQPYAHHKKIRKRFKDNKKGSSGIVLVPLL